MHACHLSFLRVNFKSNSCPSDSSPIIKLSVPSNTSHYITLSIITSTMTPSQTATCLETPNTGDIVLHDKGHSSSPPPPPPLRPFPLLSLPPELLTHTLSFLFLPSPNANSGTTTLLPPPSGTAKRIALERHLGTSDANGCNDGAYDPSVRNIERYVSSRPYRVLGVASRLECDSWYSSSRLPTSSSHTTAILRTSKLLYSVALPLFYAAPSLTFDVLTVPSLLPTFLGTLAPRAVGLVRRVRVARPVEYVPRCVPEELGGWFAAGSGPGGEEEKEKEEEREWRAMCAFLGAKCTGLREVEVVVWRMAPSTSGAAGDTDSAWSAEQSREEVGDWDCICTLLSSLSEGKRDRERDCTEQEKGRTKTKTKVSLKIWTFTAGYKGGFENWVVEGMVRDEVLKWEVLRAGRAREESVEFFV
jgi:hypothetical protein